MASLFKSLTSIPKGIFNAGKSAFGSFGKISGMKDFLQGDPESQEYIYNISPEQRPLATQAINAGLGKGAGGAYGTAADYYYNLLGNNPEDFDMFAAPEMRRFNEQIIPQLSEQFAGMGSGALSSSGFRNAAVSAGTDLSERLANIRAQLRQNAAQGLMGIGQAGLQPFGENFVRPGTPGFLENIAPAAGQLLGGAIGSLAGPGGAAVGSQIGGAIGSGGQSWLAQSRKGKSSPYGAGGVA